MVHEQGFGPQDNTKTRALARTKTLNNPVERAIKSVVKALCLEGAECERFKPTFKFFLSFFVSCGSD